MEMQSDLRLVGAGGGAGPGSQQAGGTGRPSRQSVGLRELLLGLVRHTPDGLGRGAGRAPQWPRTRKGPFVGGGPTSRLLGPVILGLRCTPQDHHGPLPDEELNHCSCACPCHTAGKGTRHSRNCQLTPSLDPAQLHAWTAAPREQTPSEQQRAWYTATPQETLGSELRTVWHKS